MADFVDNNKSNDKPHGEVDPNENPFTSFYSQFLHQGNMLADTVRTGLYQKSIIENPSDFYDKVVLDVGTGSGILSFFALQAGAKKVYAVDASEAVNIAKVLAKNNGYEDRIEIIKGKIEEINLPEQVDVIISEPIGFMLLHERMIESYIVGRNRFLKKYIENEKDISNGDENIINSVKLYPSCGSIIITAFSDDHLHYEHMNRAAFWDNEDFFGLNLKCVHDLAREEYFSQVIVGKIAEDTLISNDKVTKHFDFRRIKSEELLDFEMDFHFEISKTCLMHGFAGWFDLDFLGTDSFHVLSTAPSSPVTHWYQCRFLFQYPIGVNAGQFITGKIKFQANNNFSYNVIIDCSLDNSNVTRSCKFSLKEQVSFLFSLQSHDYT